MCVMYTVVMLNDNNNGVKCLTFNILFHTTCIIESENGLGCKGPQRFAIPCHGQGHISLDQIAQSSIQPGLKHF